VAQYQPDEPTAAWLERVDHCLYRAKQSGRNRVELATHKRIEAAESGG
jgi:PleD family two-component response regulator